MRRLVFLALAACGGGDDSGGAAVDSGLPAEAFRPPDQAGPYVAATLESQTTPPHGVTLNVQAWYPTEETGEMHVYDGIFASNAVGGAAAACGAPRPVAVFSHGNGGIRWQSPFIAEHLASRGWVVIAPDHTGNTFLDMDEARLAELVFRRPLDVAGAFDWLVEVAAAPGGPLAGCVAPEDGYAMMGHSFGGYTTFAVVGAAIDPDVVLPYCEETGDWLCDEVEEYFSDNPVVEVDLSDSRAWAGVPITPAGMGALAGGVDRINVPMLVWGGALDSVTTMEEQVRPLYEGLSTTPRHLATITDAGHYSYTILCDLLPTFDDCAPPVGDAADTHALATTMTTAFLDLHRGFDEAAAWLPVDDASLEFETVE
jgi:predicted dienelactone hydrolase